MCACAVFAMSLRLLLCACAGGDVSLSLQQQALSLSHSLVLLRELLLMPKLRHGDGFAIRQSIAVHVHHRQVCIGLRSLARKPHILRPLSAVLGMHMRCIVAGCGDCVWMWADGVDDASAVVLGEQVFQPTLRNTITITSTVVPSVGAVMSVIRTILSTPAIAHCSFARTECSSSTCRMSDELPPFGPRLSLSSLLLLQGKVGCAGDRVRTHRRIQR